MSVRYIRSGARYLFWWPGKMKRPRTSMSAKKEEMVQISTDKESRGCVVSMLPKRRKL